MRNAAYHMIVGNARSRRTVGMTRGVVASGLMGVVNAILLFVPIPAETKVELNVAIGPVVIWASYFAFGQLDKAVKGEES